MPKRWFSLAGRMGRGAYNSANVVAIVLILVAQIIFVMPLFVMPLPEPPITLTSIPLGWNAVVAGFVGALGLWIAISTSVRRLHDLGWSGMWLALLLAPLAELAITAGVGMLIILAFLRGNSGPNAYGENTPPNTIA